jgi:PAT family beta-lactamase induction signal transducer AmpG
VAARDKPTTSPHLWVSSTYFAEGYPYTVVNNIAEILFKELGASLQVVGLTALFHLPWNLKFLWGPLIDQYETKRRWLIGIEVALSLTLVVLSFFVSVGAAFGVLAATFLVMAFLSATHDIAIDGYYLEGLDERGQSKFVGFRAMSFRVAAMILSGPGLIFIGWAGWNLGFVAITLVMIGLSVGHWFLLPRIETRQRPIGQLLVALVRWPALVVGGVIAALVMVERKVGVLAALAPAWHRLVDALPAVAQIPSGGWIALGLMCALLLLLALRRRLGRARSAYARAFVSFLEQPKVGRVLAFVVLFRAGESFLMKMKWPFLKDVVNMPLDHYGFANGTVGLVASFSATMLGGWLISRDGLRRWIWPFMIAQNVLNLLYVGLAFSWFGPSPGLAVLTAVITFERLGEGLGTAVFMVYLMRCCDPAHKAAHMAIVTALMSVAFTIAGVASGFMADALGFGRYFVFTFIATLPAMGLIFLVPHLDGRESAIAPT